MTEKWLPLCAKVGRQSKGSRLPREPGSGVALPGIGGAYVRRQTDMADGIHRPPIFNFQFPKFFFISFFIVSTLSPVV